MISNNQLKYTELVNIISKSRLSTYNNDISLYIWNTKLSENFFFLLQNLEVGLRNAIYNAFLKQYPKQDFFYLFEALRAINKELISLYWDIGKTIVQRQEKLSWGKSVVKILSQELQKEFVGVKGFSVQNLWNMRQFYLEYRNDEKLQPLVGEISWTKNVVIFQKVIKGYSLITKR